VHGASSLLQEAVSSEVRVGVRSIEPSTAELRSHVSPPRLASACSNLAESGSHCTR